MEYAEKIKGKLQRYFDISDDFQFAGKNFEFYAQFNQRNVRYVLTKSAEVFAFNNNEYIFYQKLDRDYSSENLSEWKSFLEKNVDSIINIDNEHMSSFVTLIVETINPIDEKMIREINKFKFYKSYSFGFKGWVNCKLIVIDKSTNSVFTNKLARKNAKNLLS